MSKREPSKVLSNHQKIGDFFRLILKEVEGLGGSEEDMLAVIEKQGKNKLPHLIARVITNTARVKKMDWEAIARSKNCSEEVRAAALDYINDETVLKSIITAEIMEEYESSPNYILSRHEGTKKGHLDTGWVLNFGMAHCAISRFSRESVIQILKSEPSDFVAECFIRIAIVYACEGWDRKLKEQALEIIKNTKNLAILSQLNNDNGMGQGDETSQLVRKRIAEISSSNI